jgi:hypothetical protein
LKDRETTTACGICQRPHAKRRCPAIKGYICSLCCGNKRKREIDCPDNCEYLVQAKNRWILKLQISAEQIDFWQAHFDIIHNIELAILQVKQTQFCDVQDSEVEEALENLIKTFETEERGVIYDYKSSNYRIQTIIDDIQNIINQHRHSNQSSKFSLTMSQQLPNQPEKSRLRRVPLAETISSLKFILNLDKQCINKKTSNSTFFDFIVYFVRNALITEDS